MSKAGHGTGLGHSHGAHATRAGSACGLPSWQATQALASAPAACSQDGWAAGCWPSPVGPCPHSQGDLAPVSFGPLGEIRSSVKEIKPSSSSSPLGQRTRQGQAGERQCIARAAGCCSLHDHEPGTPVFNAGTPAPLAPTDPLDEPLPPPSCPSQAPLDAWHSQEEDDTSVGHGVGQPQDATAHDGIAQVEDGHPKRRLPFKLHARDNGEGVSYGKLPPPHHHHGAHVVPRLTSVKCVCCFSAPCGRNSSISAALDWFSSNLDVGGRRVRVKP